jgi:hypothetical protein
VENLGRAAQEDTALKLSKGDHRMTYEQKDNSGAIFVNDHKQEDAHPDRSGSAKIGGVDYWVNGWLRKNERRQALSQLVIQAEKHIGRRRRQVRQRQHSLCPGVAMTFCPTCGADPCINPSFCKLCREADRKKERICSKG